MVQGFYTLEEAARVLGLATEELTRMAQKREIRAFADRGTWRFRTQDIEELARRRGLGSSPDLPLGEAPKPEPEDSPSPRATKTPDESDVFTLALGQEDEEQIEIGQELVGSGSGSKKDPLSPPPKPGSDSDVRLVAEGSDINLKLASDSDVRMVADPIAAKDVAGKAVGNKPKSDSDVKIVPDSDPDESGIGIGKQPPKTGTDSDIRLEVDPASSGARRHSVGVEESMLTEEIDLDAELRRAEEEARGKKPRAKPSSGTQPTLPAAAFDLSDSELEAAPPPGASQKKSSSVESSSDFDLTPHSPGDSSPIAIDSDELPKMDSDELELAPSGTGKDSGINLDKPADSGISLEQGGESDSIEFELSLDAGSTPKPKPVSPVEDDSSSEFELSLDDSGSLAPLEDDSSPVEASSGEKDIFETDFDVPSLEEESGSQVAALEESDTDLESSDFDLALSDEDISTEDESGSQVVALEDEEGVDEGAATVARAPRPVRGRTGVVDQEVDDVSAELEAVEEADERDYAEETYAPARPAAEWPAWMAAVSGFGAILLLLVGFMGFELIQNMWGYRQSTRVTGALVRGLSGLLGAELPND